MPEELTLSGSPTLIPSFLLSGYLGKENSRHYLPAVASAQRAVREVAAYLLDRGHAKASFESLNRKILRNSVHIFGLLFKLSNLLNFLNS